MARTVVVLGASSDRGKWGNKAVRAFRDKGFTVYPVNPGETEIEGLTVYPSIAEVPCEKPDMVTVYLAPPRGLKVIEAIAAKGCGELWLNPGAESPELVQKAEALGLKVRAACSILGIGANPGAY